MAALSPDEACQLLLCHGDAQQTQTKSGDIDMPEKKMTGTPVKYIEGGVPVKNGGDKMTCSEDNQTNVWKWTEKILGIKFEIYIVAWLVHGTLCLTEKAQTLELFFCSCAHFF